MNFTPMPKTPRLSREIIITEKIDGTNASVFIQSVPGTVFEEDGPLCAKAEGLYIYAGSRTRWVTPKDDNYGFARWVQEHAAELALLGSGHHFGEWWGKGINRGYGLEERRFSLFNVNRWGKTDSELPMQEPPACCHVVPVLYRGPFETHFVHSTLEPLCVYGSIAAPGFMDPEGVMVYHTAANQLFKKTIKGDEEGKHAEAHPPKVERPPRDKSKGGRRIGPSDLYVGIERRKT